MALIILIICGICFYLLSGYLLGVVDLKVEIKHTTEELMLALERGQALENDSLLLLYLAIAGSVIFLPLLVVLLSMFWESKIKGVFFSVVAMVFISVPHLIAWSDKNNKLPSEVKEAQIEPSQKEANKIIEKAILGRHKIKRNVEISFSYNGGDYGATFVEVGEYSGTKRDEGLYLVERKLTISDVSYKKIPQSIGDEDIKTVLRMAVENQIKDPNYRELMYSKGHALYVLKDKELYGCFSSAENAECKSGGYVMSGSVKENTSSCICWDFDDKNETERLHSRGAACRPILDNKTCESTRITDFKEGPVDARIVVKEEASIN